MTQIIKTYIENKYYTFVPGEFFPILSGDELINKREFHAYKLARAKWRISRRWNIIANHLQTG